MYWRLLYNNWKFNVSYFTFKRYIDIVLYVQGDTHVKKKEKNHRNVQKDHTQVLEKWNALYVLLICIVLKELIDLKIDQ